MNPYSRREMYPKKKRYWLQKRPSSTKELKHNGLRMVTGILASFMWLPPKNHKRHSLLAPLERFLSAITRSFLGNPVLIPDSFHLISTVDPTNTMDLCWIPSLEEIEVVIKSMGPVKAPGPDGLPALFF